MAFNPLERLEQGNYDFVHNLTSYEHRELVTRVRNLSNRNDIINGFIKFKNDIKYFCFDIIYDIEEYKKDVFELLESKNILLSLLQSSEKVRNILYNTSWGKQFVLFYLDDVITGNEDNLNVVLEYIFTFYEINQDIINKLSLHENLHVRFCFMNYLVNNHLDKVELIYDDITKYLTSYTDQEFEQLTFLPELMDKSDISYLAISIYNSQLNKSYWYKIKEFILDNYKDNLLAYLLLNTHGDFSEKLKEFSQDADRLFLTSYNYKINIYYSYSEYLSQEIIDGFTKYLKYFCKDGDFDNKVSNIMQYGLWDKLEKYVDKYLSLSKKTDFEYLDSGSTLSCFKIGDFAFKLGSGKYSYEDIICPNMYLIIKNLEEDYVRNELGHVVANLEVQPCLSKKDVEITSEHIKRFKSDMANMGYYVMDTLIYGNCGDNCMLLDSYKDADCLNPEALPQHFKDFPLVLVDRDLVFKIGSQKIKSRLLR